MAKILSAILLITVFVALATASEDCGTTADEIKRNLAIKWASAFKSINSTLYVWVGGSNPNGIQQYPPDVIGGNIAYNPAVIGIKKLSLDGQNYDFPVFGLFGNITVLYGIPGQPTGVTSYSGAFDLQPDILANGLPSCETGLVNHRIQISNINNPSYAPGALAVRRYTWHDTEAGIDNVLQLSVAGVAELFWRRNVPLPISSFSAPSDCTATATLSVAGSWANNVQYQLAITNTGSKTITGLVVKVNLGSSTITSQYNINVVSGRVSNFYQVVAGGSFNGAGFVAQGPDAAQVTTITATCAAN